MRGLCAALVGSSSSASDLLLHEDMHQASQIPIYIYIYREREQVAVGPGFLQTHFLYHIYILTTSST